jgi:hypothetical protein
MTSTNLSIPKSEIKLKNFNSSVSYQDNISVKSKSSRKSFVDQQSKFCTELSKRKKSSNILLKNLIL